MGCFTGRFEEVAWHRSNSTLNELPTPTPSSPTKPESQSIENKFPCTVEWIIFLLSSGTTGAWLDQRRCSSTLKRAKALRWSLSTCECTILSWVPLRLVRGVHYPYINLWMSLHLLIWSVQCELIIHSILMTFFYSRWYQRKSDTRDNTANAVVW